MKFLSYIYIISLVLLVTLMYGGQAAGSCSPGWFGTECRYKCQCTNNNCSDDGECTRTSTCKEGWFGPSCQYVDLIKTNSTSDVRWMKDNCNAGYGAWDLSINFTDVFYFTWLRLRLASPGISEEYSVRFTNTSASVSTNCSTLKVVSVNRTVVHIHCDYAIAFNQLTISGNGIQYLCSLQVSGGRNVALKQSTNQSSNYLGKYISDYAVDGKRNSDFNDDSCTHTSGNEQGQWTLSFTQTHRVNRYAIYNRKGGNSDRLQYFRLLAQRQNLSIAFNYTDTITQPQAIYYVRSTSPDVGIWTVTMITMSADKFLTICEFEMFGDTFCGTNKYGRDCEKTCNCTKGEKCFVSTGGCPSGCPVGYEGENCQVACEPTYYGTKCNDRCSTNCTDQTCDNVYGNCLTCVPGKHGLKCDQVCDVKSYGQNCSMNCSNNCTQQLCQAVNGECYSCVPGKQGQYCDEVCNATFWGQDCASKCSQNCKEPTCDAVNGTCQSCVDGKQGLKCDKDCNNTYYGPNCTRRCNTACKDQRCNSANGICTSCKPGMMGSQCEKNCSDKSYGENCAYNCSNNCEGQTCDSALGACFKCVPGKVGHDCGDDENSVPVSAIIGPIVAFIVIIGSIIIGVIFWRKKHHKKEVSSTQATIDFHELADNNNGDIESKSSTARIVSKVLGKQKPSVKVKPKLKQSQTMESVAPGGTYYNNDLIKSDTAISVRELNNFMSTHGIEYFQNQFASIPSNSTATINAASDNVNKNRYKNISAYDHSRVYLQTNPRKQHTDYINACYIHGFCKEMKFIASQGPTKIILEDFVRMLWEQKTEVVIMLTNLIEEGKLKAEQYWPKDGEMEIGEITIKLTTTQVYADYTIRRLELRKVAEPVQNIAHFHFTTWPDKNVPSTAWGLVDLEQRIAKIVTDKPIVVHCSAGVGRTGTFIALHNALEESEKTGYMDFFKTVEKLRKDRMFMVQTASQYEFLHKATQIALICKGTTMSSNDIQKRLKFLDELSPSGTTNVEEEFKSICMVCDDSDKGIAEGEEQSEHMYFNSRMVTNKMKNRVSNVLPKEAYRPVLASSNDNKDDYINAVFVSSSTKHDHNFLTQLPLPSTIIDFWRLVTQYKVALIVAFERNLRNTDMTIGDYLPDEVYANTNLAPFNIEIKSSETEANLKFQRIIITIDKAQTSLPNVDKEYSVKHITCEKTDLNSDDLIHLVRQVWAMRPVGDGRILYMCRNGATFSGLLCVLSVILERMDNDQQVSVPLVVGEIKAIRPQVIPTLNQYKLLYKTLNLFVASNNVYSNCGSA